MVTALEESATRAGELATGGDHDGAVTWRRITDAVGQLANKVPPGPLPLWARFILDTDFINIKIYP
jgi:hypothetical protein